MAATKNKAQSGRNIHTPKKKPLVVQYNKQANKTKIRSVTPGNVQECLYDMGLDVSKHNEFKAQLQRHQWMNMLDKIEQVYINCG